MASRRSINEQNSASSGTRKTQLSKKKLSEVLDIRRDSSPVKKGRELVNIKTATNRPEEQVTAVTFANMPTYNDHATTPIAVPTKVYTDVTSSRRHIEDKGFLNQQSLYVIINSAKAQTQQPSQKVLKKNKSLRRSLVSA